MTIHDDGENIGLIEPLLVPEEAGRRSKLNDLALVLAEKSAAFSSSLPPAIAISLADLIRIVNCHYSNLIEGHDAHPRDVARAILEDYSDDPEKRALQLEARAHISVQKWIDDGGIDKGPFSTQAIRDIHRRFYGLEPSQRLLMDTGSDGEKITMVPGALRSIDVRVGRHVAISPGAVPRFLARLEEGYGSGGRIDTILSAACGHHRLLWVHPFPDGNGRIARFVSHATLRSALRTSGLWSAARGLARREQEYKKHLQSCDEACGGRRALAEGSLASFAEFFLETCIDQVDFMSDRMQPHNLRARVLTWAQEEIRAGRLPPKSETVLTVMLYRGELDRVEVPTLMAASDRSARRLTAALIDTGVVQSQTSRSPLQMAFPVGLATRFLPGLFPEH
ncbi:Fic family protein [Rhizobium sp. BK060]|uniref:Fic family protein n=1 Tax=Rhizobium sp. BK060 TaxID=2587096 RepID=UPI00161C15A0|nr:Fic family protein [Rhizobium sp. BK060]MBB3394246.1 Fic family protein [Rhizobium sp. BK060]